MTPFAPPPFSPSAAAVVAVLDDSAFDHSLAAVSVGVPDAAGGVKLADDVEDRRRSLRRTEACDAFIASPTATDPTERWEVRGVNLSRHGIAFRSPIALPPRAFFAIDFGLGSQRVRCEIRVTNCREAGDGTFEVGGEFV